MNGDISMARRPRSLLRAAAAVALGSLASACARGQEAPLNPVESSREVLVFTHLATDFGARAGDGKDDTAALQKAINAARDAGGGIVYVPEGTYTLRGRLEVHSGVTLRGVWSRPDGKGVRGSLLQVYYGRGKPDGTEFVRLRAGATLSDMAFHYPEQGFSKIVPYAPTVGLCGNAAATRLTLVNPYVGLRNVHSALAHYLKECYGTPLSIGVNLDFCTDVGRISETEFSPRFWEQSGLTGSPRTEAERRALRRHLMTRATAIRLGYTDGEHLTNVRVRGYRTGLWLTRRADGGKGGLTVHSYGEASGLRLEGCAEALRADFVNHIVGWRFSGSRFAGRNAAVKGTGGSTLQFAGCAFSSEGGPAVQFPAPRDVDVWLQFRQVRNADVLGRTGMTFHACRFEKWKGVAVDALSGQLSVTDCDFLADAPAARLGPGLVAATMVGNRFKGRPRIENGCKSAALDHKPLEWEKVELRPHVYAPDPRPRGGAIFNVRDAAFGARGDGKVDDSAAIAGALRSAGEKGGTVFLPAGIYRCRSALSVPAGVELRGVGGARGDASFGGMATPGTMLLCEVGRGRAEGDPFIRVGESAGVRGLRIAYPGLLDLGKIAPYPWTIRLKGRSSWAMDLCVNNGYRVIDARGDRHLVRNVLVNALKLALRVDGCTGGVVEDLHVHPQYHSTLLEMLEPDVKPRTPAGRKRRIRLYRQAVAHSRKHVTCFEIGACRAQRFVNPSTWPSDVGFRVTSPRAQAHILNCTLETHVPMWLEQAGRVELVNANAPSFGIRSGARYAGRIHVVNYLLRNGHGGKEILDLRGPGTVTLTQCWFKWIPRGGQELLYARGRLRLLGGMMLDVSEWRRGTARLELVGTIGNRKAFGAELKAGRACAGTLPHK